MLHFQTILSHYNFHFVKNIFLLFSFIGISFFASAQSFSIKGIVVDEKNQTLIGATVAVLNPADKSIINGNTTDINGVFRIDGLSNSKILLKISYLGYTDVIKFFMAKDSVTNAGTIQLSPDATMLKDVKIVGQEIPSKQKGDTTEINANAFKTNPDATSEDLVSKMPGITSQNGTVTAHGETVKKILVDGKPFFGDDPTTTLKNLPAEVIDKVQVYDAKSDQATFSGFDDGSSNKTMNIITKPQFRNGSFGKFYAGGGEDENNDMRYKAGESINYFKGQRRISILSQSNNINEQNFAPEDLMGVGGGGPGGGGAGNFLINQQSGITQTHAVGLNYSDKWGKKTEITTSYFYNYGDNKNSTDALKQLLSRTPQDINSLSIAETRNQNHRFNFKLESKLDSMNSIIFQPKISVQQNNNPSAVTSSAIDSTASHQFLNSTYTSNQTNKTALNISSTLLWRHAFHKKFRTFSASVTPGYSSQVGPTNYNSITRDTLSTNTLNELINLNKKGYNTTSNLTYTEPIDSSQSLMATYNNSFNYNNSKRNVLDNTSSSDTLVSNLSNDFKSLYQSHSGGLGYNLRKKALNLTASVNYQWAQLSNQQAFPISNDLTKQFTSVLPNIEFKYKFSNEKNIRINFRTSNNTPSVDQLQNVYNTTNPSQVTVGNVNLSQDYTYNLVARFANMNMARNTTMFGMIGGTYTNNYIGNSTTIAADTMKLANGSILPNGGTLVKPINLDGYYSLRTFIVYGFPVKKLKMNFNVNFSGNYSHTPSQIIENGNTYLNYATNPSASLGVGFSSNISPRFDYNISSNTSYNESKNSFQSNVNQKYWAQTTRAKINIMPWKGLVITTDVAHQYYDGLTGNFNQNYLLWNGAIGYKFLKKQAGDLRLVMTDILNQNTSVSRTITDSYIQDSRTTVLRRYVMLVFTYTFKNFGGKFPGSDGEHHHWMMPPGGMPGGGYGPPGGRF